MKKLENDPNQPVLTVKKMKVVRREASREARAKKVALIENSIEKELLDRLQKGVYGEIYNLPQNAFDSVLEKHGQQDEMEEESEDEIIEYVEGDEEEEEYEEEVEYEEDFVESDEDLEDFNKTVPIKTKKSHIEIEYEENGSNINLLKN
jgi:protein MAK16